MNFLLFFAVIGLLWVPCQAQQQLRRGKSKERQLPVASLEGTKEWSYEFVKRAAVGFNMTLIVKDDYLTKEKIANYHNNVFQSFRVFTDILDDKTVVAKVDDVCYLAIRGQERHIILDIWQTLSPFVKRNVFNSGCDVKRSFYRAYNAPFATKMLQALDECATSCGEEQCPVVLHGHSTGAAAISIAALDPRIKKYNPTIFSMAPLRGIVSAGCADPELNNVYRIVLAYSGIYDGASTGRLHWGHHYGKFFIIDEMTNPYFIAMEDNVDRAPEDMALHGLEVYHQRMNALARRPMSDFPLQLTKFQDGHWCNFADECASSLCSESKVCASPGEEDGFTSEPVLRMVGSACAKNDQCDTGLCKYGTCAPSNGIMAEGSPCQDHSDCSDTQYCATTGEGNTFCLSKLYNDSFCQADYECVSQSCSGELSIIASMSRRCADP